MPRRARQVSSTGVYHVMNRGLNKMPIFKQNREKTRIVNLIRENLSKYDVAIFAYCIMPNHFHLLIKADIKELASFMAKVLAAFAYYYNYKHQRIGYVFQDRYKSQCIEDERYLWNCLRYIHMNPSKTGKIEDVFNYGYSSIKEIYYRKPDILSEEIFLLVDRVFRTSQDFLEFHKAGSWDIFEDVEEDLETNNLRIAYEILEEYRWKYNLSNEELLDFIETRKEFEKELIKILQISQKKVIQIEKDIRRELKGTG